MMRSRITSSLFTASLLWTLACTGVFADDVRPGVRNDADKSDTSAWLLRIHAAAQKLNYAGSFIYQEGAQMQSSRITHMFDAGGEHEKLEVRDGQAREFIRFNDEVRCYVPDRKIVIEEKRDNSDAFPALLSSQSAELDTYYKISRSGSERVAGHICNLISVESRDHLRYSYRLWADQETGLLLKAQTLDPDGNVLEQAAFTDIKIGMPIDKSRLRPSAESTDSWHTDKFEMLPANLTAAGWGISVAVPGFHKIREVKRAFGGHRDVGQIVYSDGLSAISVFIEPVAAHNQHEGIAANGVINVMAKRYGDYMLTVVGEVPAVTIRQFANAVEFKPPAKPPEKTPVVPQK